MATSKIKIEPRIEVRHDWISVVSNQYVTPYTYWGVKDPSLASNEEIISVFGMQEGAIPAPCTIEKDTGRITTVTNKNKAVYITYTVKIS